MTVCSMNFNDPGTKEDITRSSQSQRGKVKASYEGQKPFGEAEGFQSA